MSFELFFQQFSIVSMGVYAFFNTSFPCFISLNSLKISEMCFVARGKQ